MYETKKLKSRKYLCDSGMIIENENGPFFDSQMGILSVFEYPIGYLANYQIEETIMYFISKKNGNLYKIPFETDSSSYYNNSENNLFSIPRCLHRSTNQHMVYYHPW